jgi:molybdenum cofactor biosynthesis enzyme MoaA
MVASVHDNKLRIEYERERGALTVGGSPYYYHVHLSMPCNQKCIMCVPDGRHARDTLPFEQFEAIFEKVKAHAEHITLIGGEPLMYPRFLDVLDLLAQHEVAVTINTNATMLTGRVVPRLLALHELWLKCSIDAATRETYRRIRGTDVFDKVTAHIEAFCREADSRPHLKPILVYVVMRENLDEVLPFVDLAAERLRPYRIHFNPVRHVSGWQVSNGTGWHFDGLEQSCEYFADEYNAVLRAAAARCDQLGLRHDVVLV